MSHEQSLIADLTKTAIGILNDHQAEFTRTENDSQTRKVTTPNHGGCSLVETLAPEGVRSFQYIRPVMALPLGEALQTTEWREGSSQLKLTYGTESQQVTGFTDDPTAISYNTELYLRDNFPLAEKQQPPKGTSKLRTFLGSLSLRRKQDQA